jgi:TPR repeat protein
LKLSAEKGDPSGQFIIGCMAENGIGAIDSIDPLTASRYYEKCSDEFAAASVCFGWCLQTGFGIPIDFTIAAEFFRKAADSNNSTDFDCSNGANNFGRCLELGQGVDVNMKWSVSYYRTAALLSDADGMYNFGRCLEYGKGVDRDLIRSAKYYRLSSAKHHSSAQNSFGICLERGFGVAKNIRLAAQYYKLAAEQGHPDGANNFGFCLENGRGVVKNFELAVKYYKFASDRGHSEAKYNYNRCLRLLEKWEAPDRSSDSISHLLIICRNFSRISFKIQLRLMMMRVNCRNCLKKREAERQFPLFLIHHQSNGLRMKLFEWIHPL